MLSEVYIYRMRYHFHARFFKSLRLTSLSPRKHAPQILYICELSRAAVSRTESGL
jgi:hypothetical protein